MEWMEELLGAAPAAAKYRAELEQMAGENARLKAENAGLKSELAQYIEQWETLDGDAVRTLQYLARDAFESADAIARTHNMNFQIAEMYLQFLVKHAYVATPAAGAGYDLTAKGRRYLLQRGLLK
jgi:regulator of replication initiation timing